jgi:hypothetical protein
MKKSLASCITVCSFLSSCFYVPDKPAHTYSKTDFYQTIGCQLWDIVKESCRFLYAQHEICLQREKEGESQRIITYRYYYYYDLLAGIIRESANQKRLFCNPHLIKRLNRRFYADRDLMIRSAGFRFTQNCQPFRRLCTFQSSSTNTIVRKARTDCPIRRGSSFFPTYFP